MKTQIIQLNNNDDLVSVRDKISLSQTKRILLVWPNRGHILNRQLELNLLKRHANNLGTQLALVTHDAEVKSIAKHLGVSVFADVNAAQDSQWSEEKQKTVSLYPSEAKPDFASMREILHPQQRDWMEHPVSRIIFFGISVFALLALGAFVLPGATIMITPRVETQSIRLSLIANPSLSDINLSTGSLPVETLDVIVEGRKEVDTSGEAVIPDLFASGILNFSNISDRTITIPTATIVTSADSEALRFITTSTDEAILYPGDTVDINSKSLIPGVEGNLPSDTRFTVIGDLRPDLFVTNSSAFDGGTDASVPAPSEPDLNRVRESLVEELEQSALAELQANLSKDDTLIAPSLKLGEILEETSTPNIGEPGRQLSLSLRLRFQAQVVTTESLQRLVKPILDTNTPQGYTPIENSLIFFQLSPPKIDNDGFAHWNIIAQRKLKVHLFADQVIDSVKGLPIDRALEQLNQSLPISNLKIQVSPPWWSRLPFLTMRINVLQLEAK